MEKLIEAVENLKKELDKDDVVLEIKKLNQLLSEDEDLKKLLDSYKSYPSKEVKNKILANKLFQDYKEKEIDLNIKILYLNNKLKELTSKGKCNL